MKEKSNTKIFKSLKEVQDAAQRQGHCHCDMFVKCPCIAFEGRKECRCWKGFKEIYAKKKSKSKR